jgi:hypothetical protein
MWIDWYDRHVVLLPCVKAILMLKVWGAGKEEGPRFYYGVSDKKNILSGIDNFFSKATRINSYSNR